MANSWMIGFERFIGRNKDGIIAWALLFCMLAAGAMVMVPGVTGVFHDDGIYVSTAKALATGQGYRLINLPGTPLQTKYPPLYPALLAVIFRIWPSFPANVVAMQWLTLFMAGASVGLCYYYVVACGYFSRPVALISGLLTVSSAGPLYYSTLLLSEMPFALFLCAALLALERYVGDREHNVADKLLLTLLIALPFLTRSIGVVLIPAALLFLLVKRRFSWLVASGLGLVVIAWFAWTLLDRQSNPNNYYYTSYWDWWRDYMNLTVLARVSVFNLINGAYSIVISGTSLAGTLASRIPTFWPFFGVPVIAAIPGIWRGLRNKQLLPWLLLFYLAMVLVWPWPPFRFIIPVLLFLLCYLIDGLGSIFRKLSPKAVRVPLVVGISGLLVFTNLWHTWDVGKFNRSLRYPTMATSWESPAGWASFADAFAWIKAKTRPTDIIAGYFDSMIYLYTDRQAFRPLVVPPASPYYGINVPVVTPSGLFRSLRADEGRYVFCTPFDRFATGKQFKQIIEDIRKADPGSIELAYLGKDRRFAVYRIKAPRHPSSR